MRDAYVVAAPIAGRLMRVDVKQGDRVDGGQSVIARMLPINPPALDIRSREQARAALEAAEAGLQLARADLKKAMAERDFAVADLARKRKLIARQITSESALDEAERAARAASANLDAALAAIAMREADIANARAQLISFNAPGPGTAMGAPSQLGMSEATDLINLTAPVSGRVLRVIQESETTVFAGDPILEIGDISQDLEVVSELLSTDAVLVAQGNPVLIRKWGRPEVLQGIVERVEPWGFTKISALGVEEQRVKAVIEFTGAPQERRTLGHGFRVEAQIVIWEEKQVLTVPTSALFRQNGKWAAFTVRGGRAHLVALEIGRNNGIQAQLISGLADVDNVILYPGPDLADGTKVMAWEIQ